MGSEAGQQSTALIEALLASPRKYSFVQAVRLLALHTRHSYGSEIDFLRKGLKVIPELTLGHPSTDLVAAKFLDAPSTEGDELSVKDTDAYNLDAIELEAKAARAHFLGQGAYEGMAQEDDLRPFDTFKDVPSYELTATFLALYGTASPLPTFYTEELIEEARNDRSGSRDFLDIFNQALYTLYYRAFQRYKLGLRTLEQQDHSVLQMQYCLLGYGGDALRTTAHVKHADLRFINLFLRRHRSAHALCLGLRWHLHIEHISVEECVLHKVPVPQDQLCRLGHSGAHLGDAVLGKAVFDRQGKFQILLRELSMEQMQDLSPQGALMQKLQNFVRQYVMGPLEYDIMLFAKAEERCIKGRLGVYSLGNTAFLHNASRPIPRVRHYLSRH